MDVMELGPLMSHYTIRQMAENFDKLQPFSASSQNQMDTSVELWVRVDSGAKICS